MVILTYQSIIDAHEKCYSLFTNDIVKKKLLRKIINEELERGVDVK